MDTTAPPSPEELPEGLYHLTSVMSLELRNNFSFLTFGSVVFELRDLIIFSFSEPMIHEQSHCITARCSSQTVSTTRSVAYYMLTADRLFISS